MAKASKCALCYAQKVPTYNYTIYPAFKGSKGRRKMSYFVKWHKNKHRARFRVKRIGGSITVNCCWLYSFLYVWLQQVHAVILVNCGAQWNDWDWKQRQRLTDAILMTGDTEVIDSGSRTPRTKMLGTRRQGRSWQERHGLAGGLVSISSGRKQYVEMVYFHILLDEFRIYFNQTKSECEKTTKNLPVGI